MDIRTISAVVWLSLVSILSVVITVYDKSASKSRRKGRIPEKTLFLSALLGGSVAMYLTMLLIGHKTKHKCFMLGIPVIIIVQYSIIWYCVRSSYLA